MPGHDLPPVYSTYDRRRQRGRLIGTMPTRENGTSLAEAVMPRALANGDGGPEFVVARPGSRESCLFTRVRPIPGVGCNLSRSMRRVFEQGILAILFSAGDC